MDEALNRFAFVLTSERRTADAAIVYRRIVDEHPASSHYAGAAIALGDTLFESTTLAPAAALYDKARHHAKANASLRAYATYKLAWTELNLARPRDAYARFVEVTAIAGSDPQTVLLVREARKDLVRAYASFGSLAGAHDAFEKVAPTQGIEMLERLGDMWLDQGRSLDAIGVFDELARRSPFDPRQCDWQLQTVRASDVAGDARLVAEIERLHLALARVRKLKKMTASRLAECTAQARKRAVDMSARLASDARKLRDPRPADLAERLHHALEQSFPDEPDLRFARAKTAWTRAELEKADPAKYWQLAADRFTEVIIVPGVAPKLRDAAADLRDRARAKIPVTPQGP
jgi:hypothetical protein